MKAKGFVRGLRACISNPRPEALRSTTGPGGRTFTPCGRRGWRRARGGSLVAAAVATLAFGATPTRAQPDPKPSDGGPTTAPQSVYVLAVPGEPKFEAVAARVGTAARASLREVEGARWRRADRRFLGYEESLLDRLQRARVRLEQGRDAYLNLKLMDAIELLNGAVEDFEAAAPAVEGSHDLGDALLFLGASQVFENERGAAARTFRRMHVQMPHVKPDPNQFNPDVVGWYRRVGRRLPDEPRSSVRIETDEPGAIAYVDFVPRGTTPIEIDGLMRGEHTVRVSRPGARPHVERIRLRPGHTRVVKTSLEADPELRGLADAVGRVEQAVLGGDAPPAVREVAAMLGVDKLGVIRVGSHPDGARVGLEITVYDVDTGYPLLREQGSVPTEPGEAFVRAVDGIVSGSLTRALRKSAPKEQASDDEEIPAARTAPVPQAVRASEDEEDTDPPWWSEWWVWTAIGGAVAVGLTVGVYFAAGNRGDSPGTGRNGQVVIEF